MIPDLSDHANKILRGLQAVVRMGEGAAEIHACGRTVCRSDMKARLRIWHRRSLLYSRRPRTRIEPLRCFDQYYSTLVHVLRRVFGR